VKIYKYDSGISRQRWQGEGRLGKSNLPYGSHQHFNPLYLIEGSTSHPSRYILWGQGHSAGELGRRDPRGHCEHPALEVRRSRRYFRQDKYIACVIFKRIP